MSNKKQKYIVIGILFIFLITDTKLLLHALDKLINYFTCKYYYGESSS